MSDIFVFIKKQLNDNVCIYKSWNKKDVNLCFKTNLRSLGMPWFYILLSDIAIIELLLCWLLLWGQQAVQKK